jgi:thiol-disulfide isomerase/thioredoxin
MTRLRRGILALLCALCPLAALAGEDAPPHLSERGRADYARFPALTLHRAFVVAPGGAWAWRAEADSPQAALEAALADCRKRTPQTCVPYAVDDAVVFDAAAWPRLWGPYAGATQAAAAAVGTRPGERFFNLALRAPQGTPGSVAGLSGKVVLLHFWGSWCGPCRHEMPDLQRLYDSLRDRDDVVFVPLQVRERYAASRRWAEAQGIRLPLWDSGSAGEDDRTLPLAGGGRVADRALARFFPTSYVLDKRGVVLFSHIGPVPRWREYAAFLRDAAERSGK